MKKIFIAILAVLCSEIVSAQVTFSSLSGPNGGGILDIQFNSSSNVFAIVGTTYGGYKPLVGSVYRSTNSGSSWTKISTGTNGLTDQDAYAILVDASDNIYVLGKSKIYKSTAASNGDSWTSVSPSSPFNGGEQLAKTTDGDLFIVNGSQGVLRSADDGATWADITNNLPTSPFLEVDNIIAVGNDIYVGATNNGTWMASDPSNSSPVWVDFNSGLTTPDQPSSFALKGSKLYQSNRSGVFYYDDILTTWVQVAQNSTPGDVLTYVNEDFNSGQCGVASGPGTNVLIYFGIGRAYSSSNPGISSWSEITGAEISNGITKMATFTTTVLAGYSGQGIQRSTNSGTSWSFSDTGIFYLGGASFVLADNGRYLISDGSSRLAESDYGTNWTKAAVDAACGCSFNSLIKLGNGDILAIGNATYRSLEADNGTNWTLEGSHSEYLATAATYDGSTFFAYAYGSPATFYKSVDDAASFSLLSITGLPSVYDARRLAVDASNDFYVYLFNNTTSQNQLFKISGTTATQVTNSGLSNGIDDLQGFGGEIYVLGRNSSGKRLIVKTSNGGSSWTTVSSASVTPDLNGFSVVSSDVLVGLVHQSPRVLYYSNDGGSSWSIGFTEDNSDSYLFGAAIDANGYLNVALSHAPVRKSDGIIYRPAAPTNLKAIGLGQQIVTLEWDHDGQYVQDFLIERKLQGAGSFSEVGTASSSEFYFSDGSVESGQTYVYRVTARSSAGNSTSSQLTVDTKSSCSSTTIPDNRSWTATVSGFTPQSVGIKKFNSSGLYYVSDVTDGSLQDVTYIGSSSTFGQATVPAYFNENCDEPFITTADAIYPDGNGTWDGTTLTLHFQINKGTFNDTEKTVTLTLNATDPAPTEPQNVQGYVYDDASIQLQWTSDLYQAHYTIYRSTTSGFTPGAANEIGTVDYPQVTYKDIGPLTTGTTYYYQLKASNGNPSPLESGYSTEVSVTLNHPNFVLASNTVTGIQASTPFSAWGDFNNDGKEDLVLSSFTSTGGAAPLLFKNTGTGFQEVAGAFDGAQALGTPAVGDFDNDGNVDVFFASLSFDENGVPADHELWKNDGSFGFTKQSTIFKVDTSGAVNASWVDFDNDGKLDLYIDNENQGSQALYKGSGTDFTRVTTGPLATDNHTNVLGAWADYDNNGFDDVLIVSSNENSGSTYDAFRLFKNTNGTFSAVSSPAFDANDNDRIFTASWGDFDNDLDLDLFAGSQSGKNYLFKNNGDGTFTQMPAVDGTPTENVSSGTLGSAWADVDNDGDLDLIVANGFDTPSKLYLNDGSGGFTSVSGEMLTNTIGFRIAVSFADYDQDGFEDLHLGELAFTESGVAPDPGNILLLHNNNTTGNWIEIKCQGVTSNRSAIGAKIVVTTGANKQFREIMGRSGSGSQSSLIAHFGLGSATTIDEIKVTWPSGIVQTLTNQSANQLLTITEDGTPPAVTALSPANGATNVAVDTKLEITFDDTPIAVAGKKITLFKGATQVEQFNATDGTIVGTKVSFTPSANLAFLGSYKVSVDAGAFEDAYENATPAIASSSWTFTTIDDSPPDIASFDAPASLDVGFNSKKMTITVTDNSGTVSSAVLHYRKVASSTYSTLNGTTSGGNNWDFNVKETFFDATGVEYYFTAEDPAGNEGREPAGNGTHVTVLRYTNDYALPNSELGFGGTKKDWKVFTIPFVLPSKNVADVLEELVGSASGLTNKIDYRLITYKDGDWEEYPTLSTLDRGKGYFINIKTGISINIGKNLQAPSNDRDNLFQMQLIKGWNEIGNPYLVPISWDDVANFAGNTGAAGTELVKYNSSGYSNTDQNLVPFEGGFVFVDNAATISIPFSGQTAPGRVGSDHLNSDLSTDNWAVPLTLTQGDAETDLPSFGMASTASPSFDKLDQITPPRFFDYLELNFNHPEFFAHKFSRDIVPTAAEQEWDFTVESNQTGTATLSWDNTRFGANSLELYLYDADRDEAVNMRENNSYSFDLNSSRSFKIFFGADARLKVMPDFASLGKAWPNPSNGAVNIPFTLSEKIGLSHVNLEVFDLMGKKVATLMDCTLNPDFYVSQWDAGDDQVKNGFYTYRLVVSAKGGQHTYTGKLIINK